jgi:hypothetical protein
MTLKGLPWDVNSCPKIGIDICALHLKGVQKALLAPLMESSRHALNATRSKCFATLGGDANLMLSSTVS